MEASEFLNCVEELKKVNVKEVADFYTKAAVLGLAIKPVGNIPIPGKIATIVVIEGEDHYVFPASQLEVS